MGTADLARAAKPAWDITVPAQPGLLAGVAMAGFSDRTADVIEVAVVPHSSVMIIFDLGDSPLVVHDHSGQQRQGRFVAGLAPQGVSGQGTQAFECLQLRLSPLVAYGVLGASAELGGRVVDLDDLWGRDAVRIQDQLRAACSWEDRFAIAGAALVRRLDAARSVDPDVTFCWRQMMIGHGRVRIDRLAAAVGWSRKRLWSRFGAQIGLTPKRAAQLIRFDHAAHRLAAGESAALVAADTGYADQSHLNREVRAFAGTTPSDVAVTPFLAIDDVAWPALKHPPGN